eukprot:7990459-Alexandrium_andersonii.AAC.1
MKEWIKSHPEKWSWGEARGRGAQDAAWESALLGEYSQATGQEAAAVAFDCSKCYDRVDLQKAAQAL